MVEHRVAFTATTHDGDDVRNQRGTNVYDVSMEEGGTIRVERNGVLMLEIPVWVVDENAETTTLVCEFRRKVPLSDDEVCELIDLDVLGRFFPQDARARLWELVDLDQSRWARGPRGRTVHAWTGTAEAWPPGIEERPTFLEGAPRRAGLRAVVSAKGFRSLLTAISATDDDRFVCAHGNGVVQLIDSTTGKKETLPKLGEGVGQVWRSPEGVVAAHTSKGVHVLRGGSWSLTDFRGFACAPSLDGRRVALGDDHGEVQIRSFPDLILEKRFRAEHGVPWRAPWTRAESHWPTIWRLVWLDHELLAASHTFPIVSFWDVRSTERRRVLVECDLPAAPRARHGALVVFAGNGKLAVVSAEGEVLSEHRHAETMYRVSAAGLGRQATIACTQNAGTAIRVWNARTGAMIAEQPCRKNEPFAVSETTLACVHPETRELTFYELPVV